MTVISGADYFLGLRRHMEDAERAAAPPAPVPASEVADSAS